MGVKVGVKADVKADVNAAVVNGSGIVPIGDQDEMAAAGTTRDLRVATATATSSMTDAAAVPPATETSSGTIVVLSGAVASRRHPRSESQHPT